MASLSASQMVALIRDGAAEGLTDVAEHVQAEARRRAPDDPRTGGDDLRHSLTVAPASSGDLTSAVYTNKEYATYQHEQLDLRHPNGGQAKYLETAALDLAGDIERIIGAAVRRRLG